MAKDRILALLKFGAQRDLESLRQGKVYLNTWDFFAKQESDDPRLDRWEGAGFVLPPGSAQFECLDTGLVIPPAELRSLRITSTEASTTNIFCLYAAMESNCDAVFDSEALGFGDSWVILADGDEFLQRVRAAAEANGFKFDAGGVTYIDPEKHSGSYTPFHKRASFSPESEVRIVISSGNGDPVILDIGDASDIVSPVYSIDDISDRLRLHRNAA